MDAQSMTKLPYNLKIIPVDDKLAAVNPPFIALFNPERFEITENVIWNKCVTPGNEGADPKIMHIQPRSFTIEFMLDGTGVSTNGVKTPVTAQVYLFRKTTTTFNGSLHRPNALIVQYGTFICNCVLTASTVTYTMFDMTGLPIRAKIRASFTEKTDSKLSNISKMLSSPDLTHRINLKEGDLLPLLTHQTYNNQNYYLQVAKVNRLKNFRKLKGGTTLIFPPVSDR
jgi:hypothetical protein